MRGRHRRDSISVTARRLASADGGALDDLAAFRHHAHVTRQGTYLAVPHRSWVLLCLPSRVERSRMQHVVLPVLADTFSDALQNLARLGQAFAGVLTGLIAVLGGPLALRQIVNVQREMRRYEAERQHRLDAEANLNITAHYSLTRAAPPERLEPPHRQHPKGALSGGGRLQPPRREPHPSEHPLRRRHLRDEIAGAG